MKKYILVSSFRRMITALAFGVNRPEKQRELKAKKVIVQERILNAKRRNDENEVNLLEKQKKHVEEQLE